MKRLILGLTALASAGCMHQNPPAAAFQPKGPVIVRVVARDTTITARASANGPVYSLTTNQGEQIVPDMTLEQLRAAHPDLARKVRIMQADTWAGM